MHKLYIADVSGIEDDGRFTAMCRELPLYRQEKIESQKFFRDRRLSLQAGILQNEALSDFLRGCGIPVPETLSEIPVCFSRYGKPYYPEYPDFHFNISHSGTKVFCISSDRECGCDVEEIKAVRPEVAGRIMTDAEYHLFETAENRNEFFCRVWTLKESILKAIGTGLGTPMDEIQVIDSAGQLCRCVSFGDSRYSPAVIDRKDGYCYSVCTET